MNRIGILFDKYKVFLKYIVSAGISFALDLVLFSLFSFLLKRGIGDNSIFIATIMARIISSFVNYFINRNKVFKNNKNRVDIKSLFKYYLLVVIQMLVSATVVTSIYKSVHIYETLIKIPVEIVLFMINYFVQKKFIFNDKKVNFNKNKKLLSFIFAIVTTFSLLFQIKSLNFKFSYSNTMIITYIVLSILLFVYYNKYLFKFSRKKTYCFISVIFSLLMVFGYSYDVVHNSSLVMGNVYVIIFSIFKFIGYYVLFNTSIHLFDNFINEKRIKGEKLPKLFDIFSKHPFLFSFVFIFICYLPYIIAYYPVIINYDAANQIKEVMGIHTRYMDSVVLINPSVTLTNFNPLIHTFLIGGCFKIGYLLGNVNFGMFLYSIIQLLVVIGVFSYSIYYLNKMNINKKIIIAVLLIYSIVPLFPLYAMTAVKDVIFSSLILLYVIRIYDYIKNDWNAKDYILFGLLVLLIILFRNNGIYTIILTLPFVCLFKKKGRIILALVLILNIFLYGTYNKVLLPHYEISNTSVREALSIPFQQTARLVKYYDSKIDEDDKVIIDKILDYDTLGERYKTNLSDPVKNKYNKYATSSDLNNYFKVWFKYLLKYPGVYIDATINNIYGYFYPNTSGWYVYTDLNTKLLETGFDYHFVGATSFLRTILKGYANIFPYIPVVGSIANIGIIVWSYILLLGFLIVNKMKKYIILLLPSFTFILVCMASPANTYFRYVLPCVFTLPVIASILYKEFLNKKEMN